MHRVKFNDYAELLSDDLNNNNAYLYNGLITTISDFIAANDCVSGLEVTAQAVPDMTVYVKSGRIYQNGYQGLLEADLTTPLTIAPASASQPRIDLICAKYEEVEDEPEIRNVMTDVVSRNITQVEVKTRIASSIAFQVVGGTAAAEPTVPTTPEGWVALAKVTVPANASVIQQSNIVDMRPEIINIYQHDHSGGANGAKLDSNNLNNLPDLSDFTGATAKAAGKRGMVPAPAAGDQDKFLTGGKTYVPVASQTEAEGMTDDKKPMTALKVKQLIDKLLGASNGIAGLDVAAKLQSILYDFATELEAQAGTNTTKPINAAGVAAAISALAGGAVIVDELLAQNGYVKFSNGLILQWGYFYESQSDTDYRHFPVAFTTFLLPVLGKAYYLTTEPDGYVPYIEYLGSNNFLCGFGNNRIGNAYVPIMVIGKQQWGLTEEAYLPTIDFPVSFTAIPAVVGTPIKDYATSENYFGNNSIESVTVSSFVPRQTNTNGGTKAGAIRYIAVGY